MDTLDPESDSYARDLVSVIEAILEDPRQVLWAQEFKARGEAVAAMKLDGVEYEERMERLEEVTWPKPLADLLEVTLTAYRQTHPWISQDALSPKSVVREMYERGMTFNEFVSYYGLSRSEGLVLRYLTDAYRALRRTVPESHRTEELEDIIEWLGELVRQTDSSLLDEWEDLVNPSDAVLPQTDVAPPARPITANERAFTVMIRNAMFHRVELASRDEWEALGELEARVAELTDPPQKVVMDAQAWNDALGAYYDDHDAIATDQGARSPALLQVERTRDRVAAAPGRRRPGRRPRLGHHRRRRPRGQRRRRRGRPDRHRFRASRRLTPSGPPDSASFFSSVMAPSVCAGSWRLIIGVKTLPKPLVSMVIVWVSRVCSGLGPGSTSKSTVTSIILSVNQFVSLRSCSRATTLPSMTPVRRPSL